MKTLILAEIVNNQVSLATRCAITAAQLLKHPIVLLLLGSEANQVVAQAAKLTGIAQVLVNTSSDYDGGRAETVCQFLASIAENYQYIFAANSCYSKNILPRLAAILDVAHIANITEVIDATTFVRPIYAGNVFAKVQTSDNIIIGTIRHTAFSASEFSDNHANIITHDYSFTDNRSEVISTQLTKNDRPELTDARIIVSGGRGFKSKQDFENLIIPLANKFNAAIGATRAIVDAGFISNDYQVGQTGKVVAPELYIAIGISGQIQHLAGIKDSKIIVAINQDPEAPIMKIADYALKADLFVAIPELMKCLA